MDGVRGNESTKKTFSDPDDASAKTKTEFPFRSITPSSFISPSKNNTKMQNAIKSNRKSSDSPCFSFGKSKRESNQLSQEGFNFVFNDISPMPVFSEFESTMPQTPIFNFKVCESNAMCKDGSDNSNCLPNFNKYEGTLTNLKGDQNNGKVENINRKNQEEDDGKDKSEETVSIRTLFKEFTEIINEFVKERIEHEKRILALEERVESLEKKCSSKEKNEMDISPVTPANGTSSMSLNKTTPANFFLGATIFPHAANQSSLSNQSFKSCARMSNSSSLQDSSVLSDEANSPVFEFSAPLNPQNGLSPSKQQTDTNAGNSSEIKDDRASDGELSDFSASIMKSLKLEDLKEVIESSIRQAIESNLSKYESAVRE